jgi:ribulose-bisphosphate carboxylase large chain
MPVVSSGQWGGQAPETYRQTGTLDVMYLAGGGILAHPMGPAAGVRALQQHGKLRRMELHSMSTQKMHPELRETIAKFSRPK